MRVPMMTRRWVIVLLLISPFGYAADGETANSNASKNSVGTTSMSHAWKLEVIDAYADVHSGPGRGYPIFHVIEQGETIEVFTRRPDWYEVRAKGGRVGWVKASQIARTLQSTGEPIDLPSVSYGDYLKNSWRVGFTVGPFNSGELDGVDTFLVNAGYRPLSWLAFDLEAGNFYGTDIRGDLYSVNAVLEPFSRWKVSPVLLLGVGEMGINSQPKQAPLEIQQSSLQLYGIGLHYYIGRSFVIRGEYRQYSVSTNENDERLGSWKLGFNTFF